MNEKDKVQSEEVQQQEAAKPAEVAKPVKTKPVLKQARWPGHGTSNGIKNAKSVHGRMQSGRGSARGR